MTTAETVKLESTFMDRSSRATSRGDKVAATVWSCAAQLLNAAEQDSITAAFKRSMDLRDAKQQTRATALGLTH